MKNRIHAASWRYRTLAGEPLSDLLAKKSRLRFLCRSDVYRKKLNRVATCGVPPSYPQTIPRNLVLSDTMLGYRSWFHAASQRALP